MLTTETIEHLEGELSTSVGTVDLNGIPNYTRVWGSVVSDDLKTLTIFIPKAGGKIAHQNLQENPNISYNAANMATFKTLQYKGLVTEIREATSGELIIAQRGADASNDLIGNFFGEIQRQSWVGFNKNPSWAVTFKVTHIFDQTPGKMAGRAIAI